MIKKDDIKEVKNSATLKIAKYFIITVLVLMGVDLSFYLMNMASTVAFIIGFLMFIISVGLPIELIIKNNRKKNQ